MAKRGQNQRQVPYDQGVRAVLAQQVRWCVEARLHNCLSARARRMECCEAILAALQEQELTTRTRGGPG